MAFHYICPTPWETDTRNQRRRLTTNWFLYKEYIAKYCCFVKKVLSIFASLDDNIFTSVNWRVKNKYLINHSFARNWNLNFANSVNRFYSSYICFWYISVNKSEYFKFISAIGHKPFKSKYSEAILLSISTYFPRIIQRCLFWM